jgi:hypothetical protein
MGHVAMNDRHDSATTIVLAKPAGRHAKGARPKPPPRHALVRQPSPLRVRPERVHPEGPEHATVRLRLPSLAGHQMRPRHVLIGAAILAAALAGLAGAGVAAHRVDAATPPRPRSAPPSALALPAPMRLSLSATTLPSTGIHSTRPVTTGVPPVRRDDPAVANSRADAVHLPAQPQPAWNPSPAPGSDQIRPYGTAPDAGPTGNPPVDPTLPTAPASDPTTPPSDPTTPPSDPTTPPSEPTTPPSDPTTPPSDPTTPPSTTPTPPSTTPTQPSDSPTDSAPDSPSDPGSGTGGTGGTGGSASGDPG